MAAVRVQLQLPSLSSILSRPVLKITLLQVTRPYDSKTAVWPNGIMKKWKIHFNYFFIVKFCLYLSFDCYFASTPRTMYRFSLNLCNIKSFSVIEISAYLRFLHCVHIWDELACLWGRLCIVTLSIKWRLNHMQIWLSADWRIFVKTKWLHCQASQPCSLALTVQTLNAHALTPDGRKNLRMS